MVFGICFDYFVRNMFFSVTMCFMCFEKKKTTCLPENIFPVFIFLKATSLKASILPRRSGRRHLQYDPMSNYIKTRNTCRFKRRCQLRDGGMLTIWHRIDSGAAVVVQPRLHCFHTTLPHSGSKCPTSRPDVYLLWWARGLQSVVGGRPSDVHM